MKIAIITGASSGMGRRMAIELNDTIPNIEAFWLFGRRNERLEALEKQLTKPCRFFTDDLQTSAAQDTLQRALAAETPEIVFLVNAAGCGVFGPFEEKELDKLLASARLNSLALTAMCHVSLPYMTSGSSIVNMGSNSAWQPVPYQAVYGASKSYVLSLSRAGLPSSAGTSLSAPAGFPARRGRFLSLHPAHPLQTLHIPLPQR